MQIAAYENGKQVLLKEFEAAKKNYDAAVAKLSKHPLTAEARKEGRKLSVMAKKLEEYYVMLRQKLVEGYRESEESVGLEKGVEMLKAELDDITMQLQKGEEAGLSFEAEKLQSYVKEKLGENFILGEKMSVCERAFNEVETQSRMNTYGKFGESNKLTCSKYIAEMIDLDTAHCEIVDNIQPFEEGGKIYEKLLDNKVKKLEIAAAAEQA